MLMEAIMCPIKKMVKSGGLLLLVAGILLATACRNPASGNSPEWPVNIPPSKTSLNDKIAEARALYDSLAESDDGTDVEKTRYWIISKWALECAIDAAQEIAGLPNATTGQIQLALEELIEAYNTANATKKRGTKSGTLEAKIADAEALAASLQTAANGDNIPPNENWVTDAEKSKLTGAIEAAKAAAGDENVPVEDVEAALSALINAYNEVNSAKKPGTTPNKTTLIAKINEAVERMEGVGPSESGDGSEYKPNQRWVTPEAYNALNAALTAAEQARDNVNAVKVAVDAALANLITALNGFNPEYGKSVADKSELNAIIRQVEEELANVQVSDNNGLDIYDADEWVTTAEKTALAAVLNQARDIAGDWLAEQGDVYAITAVLEEAFGEFNPQAGKKAVGHLGFEIHFNEPRDETITLGANQTLSWIRNDELTITVTEEFDAYQWYVDGAIKNGATGMSITLNAGNFARNSTHFVTLKVTKGNVPYTKTLIFTVN